MISNQGHLKLNTLEEISGATLSKCRKYRYVLWRKWNKSLPTIMFIGLNPSTANEHENDPTILKCINYSKNWGFGGFYITNLFAYRTFSPAILKKNNSPVGQKNNYWILKTSKLTKKTIACWGDHGTFQDRDVQVKKLISQLYCININKTGQPSHPLYQKSNLKPILYK